MGIVALRGRHAAETRIALMTRLAETRWVFVLVALLAVPILAIRAFVFDWGQAEDFLMAEWYRRFAITRDWGWGFLFRLDNGAHPLFTQAVFVIALFSVLGFGFAKVVFASAALLAIAAAALYSSIANELQSLAKRTLALVVIALMLFHPTQANHLLWAFQVGWFLVVVFLALGIFANERLGRFGPPVSIVLGVSAMFCLAHGTFVWFGLAAHLLLQGRHRYAAIHLAGGIAGFVLLALAVGSRPTDIVGNSLLSAPAMLVYLVQLFGFVGGGRTPAAVAAVGAAGVGLALLVAAAMTTSGRTHQLWSAIRTGDSTAVERTAVTLAVYSVLAAAAFAIGRQKFGIEWAINRLHAAPLIVPAFLAIALLGIQMLGRSTLGTIAGVAALLFCGVTYLTSIPYASMTAAETQTVRALGMATSCSTDDRKVALYFNALAGHESPPTLVEDNFESLLRPLCVDRIPVRAYALRVFPTRFQQIVERDASAEQPLRTLWNVYGYSFDLQRALPLTHFDTPDRLIDFAVNNARTGSQYLPAVLKPHETFFLALGSR